MPAVQKQSEDFHSNIKLDEDDENAQLRKKRETLLKALKANLGVDVPSFEHFNGDWTHAVAEDLRGSARVGVAST